MKGCIKVFLASSIISFLSPVFAANSSKAINLFPADQAPSYYPSAKKPLHKKPVKPDTYSKKQINQVVANAGKVAAKHDASYFDGFYLGVGGGIADLGAKTKGSYAYKLADPKFSDGGGFDFYLHEEAVNANIFAGFGKTRSSFYMGGELYANYFSNDVEGSSNFNVNNNFDTFTTVHMQASLKNPYSFGGDFRLGYLISKRTMIYLLFGLDYAEFDTKITASQEQPNASISNEFNKWKWGYMPGIGIETGLSQHISLRMQYTYTFYPSFSESKSESDGDENISLTSKVDPHRSLFTIMLSYLFN